MTRSRHDPKIFTLEEPVFKTATLFVVGATFKDFACVMKRRYRVTVGDYVGQCGQMFSFADTPPWRCVWTDALDLPVILHEIFHLVTRICADKGVPIRAHNERGDSEDETAAYLFEFFARGVMAKQRTWQPRADPGHSAAGLRGNR